MQIGGHDTALNGLTVKDSRTALRIERGAAGVTATDVSLFGGTDRLVTSAGSAGIVVHNLSTDGVGQRGQRGQGGGVYIAEPRFPLPPTARR
jgi:hypothetical protein